MEVTSRGRRLARMGLGWLVALAVVGPLATPALAAGPDLSRPTSSVRFLRDITFTGTATLPGPVHRLEIVLDVEGSTRSIVGDVTPSGSSGSVSLRYVLDTPGGSMVPNTNITAHFRATLDDGTLVDGPSATVHYDDTRYDWQVLTGELVTVHWTEGGSAFGQRALRIGETAVRDVSTLLGVAESGRIDFYVYADRAAFYDILGAASRENVGGQAHPDIRTLFANIAPDAIDAPWVGIVIPHELTHLVFDTAVANPYHYPPRWLNEGIAVYLSAGYGSSDRNLVGDAVRGGTLLPLRGLAGQFPTTTDQWNLAYAESVAAVDYLVSTYGKPAMVTLVRSYAAGVTDDEAFRAALGTDVAGFEAAWLASVGAAAPSPFGPVAAPQGPIPVEWGGTPVSSDGVNAGVLVVGLVAVGVLLAGLVWWLGRLNRRSSRSRALPRMPDTPTADAPDAPSPDVSDAPDVPSPDAAEAPSPVAPDGPRPDVSARDGGSS